jgi:hypothetical protein
MHSAVTSIGLFLALVAVVTLGRVVRQHLPDTHLSADSKDAVKLAMGLVATMTALLLSLLVSSAKGTYDTQRSEVIQMAAKAAALDRALAAYGPETADVRARFREVAQDATRRMWQDGAPRAQLQPDTSAGDAFYAGLQQLSPRDDAQRAWKAQAATLAADLGQLRMLLLAQAVSSIPVPLLLSVVCWLLVIFLAFSLLAPPNATTTLSLIAAALSVAGAVFLILELDQPFRGLIRIPPEPLLHALTSAGPGNG